MIRRGGAEHRPLRVTPLRQRRGEEQDARAASSKQQAAATMHRRDPRGRGGGHDAGDGGSIDVTALPAARGGES